MYSIARHVQKHARLISVLESMDNGKPIRESRDCDIPLVARHFYHHAGVWVGGCVCVDVCVCVCLCVHVRACGCPGGSTGRVLGLQPRGHWFESQSRRKKHHSTLARQSTHL